MVLARDAIDLALAEKGNPLDMRTSRNRYLYLEDCDFRGRQNHKIKFAILAIAAGRGGVEPDLLDEIVWWRTDDFWSYALAGVTAIIRACADRLELSVPQIAAQLASSAGIDVAASDG